MRNLLSSFRQRLFDRFDDGLGQLLGAFGCEMDIRRTLDLGKSRFGTADILFRLFTATDPKPSVLRAVARRVEYHPLFREPT